MAIFKLGAMFDAISGKVGGQSLCNYPTQQILRNIVQTNKFATTRQSTQRALTAQLSNSWGFLSTAQRNSFEAGAVDYTYVNRVGDTITRNGFQTFCFLNQNLTLIGATLLTACPTYEAVDDPLIQVLDVSFGVLEIQYLLANSDYTYAIFAYPFLAPGASSFQKFKRFCGTVTAAELIAGIDIIPQIEDTFGTLSAPFRVGYLVVPINTTTGNRNQFPQEYINNVSDGSLPVYEPEYQDVLDYAELNSITPPSDAQKLDQSNLVYNLKLAGIWSKLRVFYMFATDTTYQFTMINWRNPSLFKLTIGTPANATLYTNDRLQQNASGPVKFSTDTLITDITPSLALDDLSFGHQIGSVANVNSNTFATIFGIGPFSGAGGRLSMDDRSTSVTIYNNVNTGYNAGATYQYALQFNALAFAICSRNPSNTLEVFLNGASVISTTQAPVSFSTNPILFFQRFLTPYNLRLAFLASSLDATEAAAFYSALNTYYATF